MGGQQQLCTFTLGEYFFGIDVLKVQEVVRHQPVTRVPLSPSVISGLINLRGQVVTALDLRRRLGMPDRPEDEPTVNIVVQTDDGAVSLLADDVGDVLQVEAADFEPTPETLHVATRALTSGVYKLDGRLLLVLDPDRAVDLTLSVDDCPEPVGSTEPNDRN